MQTFLPYSSFEESAKCLDNKRLGKQRVEAYQILRVLMGIGKRNKNGKLAWENHPAVKMWKGYEFELARYSRIICQEWLNRGYKDTILQKIGDLMITTDNLSRSHWIGNENLHRSHRSNLLRKDKQFYSQFGWTEPDNLPYFWPIK